MGDLWEERRIRVFELTEGLAVGIVTLPSKTGTSCANELAYDDGIRSMG